MAQRISKAAWEVMQAIYALGQLEEVFGPCEVDGLERVDWLRNGQIVASFIAMGSAGSNTHVFLPSESPDVPTCDIEKLMNRTLDLRCPRCGDTDSTNFDKRAILRMKDGEPMRLDKGFVRGERNWPLVRCGRCDYAGEWTEFKALAEPVWE